MALPKTEVNGVWTVSLARKTDATMHAAGGLGCGITDLATWVRLNLNGGEVDGRRVLSKQRTSEMQSEHAQAGTSFYEFKREAYGLGWYVGSYQGEALIHHFGGFQGARAHVSFMPRHGIGVAVVANQNSNLLDLVACDVYDTLLGLTHRRDLLITLKKRAKQRRADGGRSERGIPLATSDLALPPAAYIGTYVNDDWGTIRVSVSDIRLAASIGNVELDLVSSAADQFRTALLPGTQPTDGAFVIENAARVSAIELGTPTGPARFVRK